MTRASSYWDKVTQRRISRRRALQMAAITGASASAIALVGCGDDDDDDVVNGVTPGTTPTNGNGEPRQGGTLRGTVSLVLGRDPHREATFLAHALASYSYSRLMRYATEVGQLPQERWYTAEPELAASVENPDPTTYIFTLHDGVNWHDEPPVNGRPLTGEDVVYSFNRYREISPNAANLAMVESVEADGNVVTFRLTEPFGLFLNRIASFQDLWIMPRELVEAEESGDRMVGTGPFVFSHFDPDREIVWRRNPNYFETDANGNQLPYVDEVNLAIIADQNQVLSQFGARNLDTIFVPPRLLDAVQRENPNAIIDEAMRNILSFMYFEPATYQANQGPFNDERVRRGLSMALDREALLKDISDRGGEWASLPINAGFGEAWWLDPKGGDMGDAAQYFEYNPQEARAMIEAATGGEIQVPMHFSSTVYTTIVPYYDIVRERLGAMLGQAGINVQEVPEEYGVYITETFTGNFDGMAWGLESVFSDIAAYWTNMFYPRDAGGGRNHSSIDDPELVSRIQAMVQSQDLEEIQEMNFDLQRYVCEQMYYVPVITPIEFNARHTNLQGVVNTGGPTTYAVGTESAMWTWIDDNA
jgi:peptide/nickel transport system substrate-binding protein